jgi:hypothetical protein
VHRFLSRLGWTRTEDIELSSSKEAWWEQWWPWFVIVFGVIFVAIIDTFNPTI